MTPTMPVDVLTVPVPGVWTSGVAGRNVSTPRSPSCAASRVVPSPTDLGQVVEHVGNWQLLSVPRHALHVNQALRRTDTKDGYLGAAPPGRCWVGFTWLHV